MHATGRFHLLSAGCENCASFWFFVQSKSGRKWLCCMLTKAPVVMGSWKLQCILKSKMAIYWHNNSLASIYINYNWYQISMVGLDGDVAVNACAIHYMRRTKKTGKFLSVMIGQRFNSIHMSVSFQYGTEAVRNRMWKHTALIHSSDMDSVKQQYWDLQDHCRTKRKYKNSVFKHMKAHGKTDIIIFQPYFLEIKTYFSCDLDIAKYILTKHVFWSFCGLLKKRKLKNN